ncbi:hypothetical protein GCM10008915_61810 [Bifidobacterium pullorum subsp. gallinarum]
MEHTGWKDSQEWLQAREWDVNAWEDMLASLISTFLNQEMAFYAASKPIKLEE